MKGISEVTEACGVSKEISVQWEEMVSEQVKLCSYITHNSGESWWVLMKVIRVSAP